MSISKVEEEEEEEKVVFETDVILSPHRTGNLHLFQFPFGHSPLACSRRDLLACVRGRPANHKFEIETLFDTTSTTFDKPKSKNIAAIVNNQRKQLNNSDDEEVAPLFPNDIMDRLIIDSERMNNTTFYYGLGFLKRDRDELELIPISSVCEFKKRFKHLDMLNVQPTTTTTNTTTGGNKKVDADLDADDFVDHEEEPEENGFKKVTMRFEGRYENKRKPEAIAGKQEIESEPWCKLCYVDYGSSKFKDGEMERNLYKHVEEGATIANGFDHEMMEFSYEDLSTSHTYPQSDNTVNTTVHTIQPTTNNLNGNLMNTVSFHSLKSLSFQDQLCLIMCNSKVLPYRTIVNLLQTSAQSTGRTFDHDEQSLVRLLQQYALLVQGNWVVRSELVFPKSAKSTCAQEIPFTNVSHEMLCRARNYILWRYSRQTSLRRADLIKCVRIPADHITLILQQFALFNASTLEWDFIFPTDHQFLATHKEVAQRQEKVWEAVGSQLSKIFACPSNS